MGTKSFSADELTKQALKIRKKHLDLHFQAHSGHIGTGLSCIEILTYIYWEWKRNGDHFILSKGHAASALYATLAVRGLMSDSTLESYYKDGTRLSAHPFPNAFESIPVATGSLGHGLSIASGLALANRRFKANDHRVACLLSDGECNEGSVWEAAMFAAHHQLANLTVIVDDNKLQGFGSSSEVLNIAPLAAKWRQFGFETIDIDGHSFPQLHEALGFSGDPTKPKCVIANTVKGKGVSFMENRMEWHYLPMNQEQYLQALKDLGEVP